MPGRLIGVSIDAQGNRALRMALQTREQHIRREKQLLIYALPRILLANMAAMYAVYHGPEGLKTIAQNIYNNAASLAKALTDLGYIVPSKNYFDTICVDADANQIKSAAEKLQINFRYDNGKVYIALDETVTSTDLNDIVSIFSEAKNKSVTLSLSKSDISGNLKRATDYLTHPNFNVYHSETEMLRYIKSLN